jgi:hypothetical protein
MEALTAQLGTSVRMAAVLAFLIGMPLWALHGTRLDLFDALVETRMSSPGSARTAQRTVQKVDGAHVRLSDEGASRPMRPAFVKDRQLGQPDAHAQPAVARQLREIQQELVARGADAMLLKLLDTHPTSYCFWCQMPISTTGVYGRKFEAVASDPVLAMQQVLSEVDAWQQARTGWR